MRLIRVLFVFAVCAFGGSISVADSFVYHGFVVSEEGQGIDDSLKQALCDQIDIVLQVGFSPHFIEFFQSVPLQVVPHGEIERGTPGLYKRKGRCVKLTARMATVGHRPVLLHELLHAYHDQKIAEGFNNPALIHLYTEAKVRGLFRLKSHMMENAAEFFACAGTTFLFGVTAQEPFHRSAILGDAELMEYLQKTFGPSCGQFEGALSLYRPNRSLELMANSVAPRRFVLSR